jgi:hypothetical protein
MKVKRIIILGMALAMLLLSLEGCVDQRYVSTDAACDAMPCHKNAGNKGIVNE